MNIDEAQLLSHEIDTNGNIVEQVLRIACYDEYRANAYYQKVIDTFGNVAPFINIAQAEINHYSVLENLCALYNVQAPENDWYAKTNIEPTLQGCCQAGVDAEIANIQMYDHLLTFVTQADIRDAFYREQAASYNNHLPAFSQCVQSYSAQNTPSAQNAQTQNPVNNQNHDIYNMAQSLLNGEMDTTKLTQGLASFASRDMLLGLAIGAGLSMALTSDASKEMIDKLLNKQDETKDNS